MLKLDLQFLAVSLLIKFSFYLILCNYFFYYIIILNEISEIQQPLQGIVVFCGNKCVF